MPTSKKDLVVLAACKDGEFAIRGILSRPRSLGLRTIAFDVFTHMHRDSGVFNEAQDYLRASARTHQYAVVLLDREGSGQEHKQTREQMEADIEARLIRSGWAHGSAIAVVVDPELDLWVWSDSPQVDAALGWKDRQPDLRTWLREPSGFLAEGQHKPARPKEALDAALRKAQKPHSSATFEELGRTVSLKRCTDPAFVKLRTALQTWFGQAGATPSE